MAKRDEFDRSDLKEADQFFETVGVVQRYINENRDTVIAGAVGLVALFVAAVGGSAYVSQAKDGAAAAFARAANNVEYDSPAAAKAGFEGLVGRSLSGPYGELAQLYKADLELEAGEYAQAINDYESFLGSAATPYLEQIALLGKAFALEMSDQLAEASEVYQQAAGLEGPYTLQALHSQARTAEESGQTAAALEAIEKLLEAGDTRVDSDDLTRRADRLRNAGA